jgi:hypothetical protein
VTLISTNDTRDDFKDGNLLENVETLVNLTNPSYANNKMFGDIFVKIFNFLRILYSLYKLLAIFKVKSFYPIEFG